MPTRRKYVNHAERQAAYRQRLTARQLESVTPGAAGPLGPTRWRQLLKTAHQTLRTVHQEMESYYDTRPETWQDSERGEVFGARLECLGEALNTLAELSPPPTRKEIENRKEGPTSA